MSLKNNSADLEDIKTALTGYSQGATPEEILRSSKIKLERRTLQRRLKNLIDQGSVKTSGKGRPILYRQGSPVSIIFILPG